MCSTKCCGSEGNVANSVRAVFEGKEGKRKSEEGGGRWY